ncbi:MAG: hypothetical protein U1F43_19700 [Myxococcota bacterium]
MPTRTLAPLLCALPLLAACPPEDDHDSDAADAADATAGDAADTGAGDAATTDAGADADAEPTDVVVGPIAATPGARCELSERIGLVELSGDGASIYVSATVFDRADPWYGAPELSTAACRFFHFTPVGCGTCASDEVCAPDGHCKLAPLGRADASLTLSAGGATQTFTADAATGQMYGAVTLTGPTFALDLDFGGQHVTLGDTTMPGMVEGVGGALQGGYDHPTGLDVHWTAPASAAGSRVFTHIPINHHAGGPTFTECDVASSAASFHVDGDMLAPLAVSTGLEFQGIEHMQVARAETPQGCVEVRFQVQQYVDLGF